MLMRLDTCIRISSNILGSVTGIKGIDTMILMSMSVYYLLYSIAITYMLGRRMNCRIIRLWFWSWGNGGISQRGTEVMEVHGDYNVVK